MNTKLMAEWLSYNSAFMGEFEPQSDVREVMVAIGLVALGPLTGPCPGPQGTWEGYS